MHILKRLLRRVDGPLLHGIAAGCAILVISSLGVIGVDLWVRDLDARIGAIRSAGMGAFVAVTLLSVLAGFLIFRLSRTASRARRREQAARARLAYAKRQAEVQAQRAGAVNGVLGFANLAPMHDAAPGPATAPLGEPLAVCGRASPPAIRVLLVEDNFVNQRVAVYMLRKLGIRVDVAQHGREAVEMLSACAYDLVLMDCQMPEMDGFEATRIIRDGASGVLDHEVPVIAMTANAFPEDHAKALACGMNDFLAKPVDRSILAHMIDKWLRPFEGREPLAAPRAAVG